MYNGFDVVVAIAISFVLGMYFAACVLIAGKARMEARYSSRFAPARTFTNGPGQSD